MHCAFFAYYLILLTSIPGFSLGPKLGQPEDPLHHPYLQRLLSRVPSDYLRATARAMNLSLTDNREQLIEMGKSSAQSILNRIVDDDMVEDAHRVYVMMAELNPYADLIADACGAWCPWKPKMNRDSAALKGPLAAYAEAYASGPIDKLSFPASFILLNRVLAEYGVEISERLGWDPSGFDQVRLAFLHQYSRVLEALD